MKSLQRSTWITTLLRNAPAGTPQGRDGTRGSVRAAGTLALLCVLAPPGYAADLHAETRTNLEVALRSEAYEYLLYGAYATQAMLAGDVKLAHLFREIADEEGEDHFARELALSGRVGAASANLADAMKSEINEQIGAYTRFAEAAEKAGDAGAAALFKEVAQEEKRHFEMLQKLGSGKPAETGGAK